MAASWSRSQAPSCRSYRCLWRSRSASPAVRNRVLAPSLDLLAEPRTLGPKPLIHTSSRNSGSPAAGRSSSSRSASAMAGCWSESPPVGPTLDHRAAPLYLNLSTTPAGGSAARSRWPCTQSCSRCRPRERKAAICAIAGDSARHPPTFDVSVPSLPTVSKIGPASVFQHEAQFT
jgi:hypothetical protein